MSAPPPTFASRLRDLALALLNATLMLAVLLVFGAWLLLGRVQDFTAETVGAVADTVGGDLRERLDAQSTRISEAIDRIATLDDQLADAVTRLASAPDTADQAAAKALTGLRDDIQSLNQTLADGATDPDAPDVSEARARLTALDTQITESLDETRDTLRAVDSQTAAEITELRADVQGLTTTLQDMQAGLTALREDTSGSLRGALRQLFLDLADRVAPPGPTSPTTEG